MTTPNGAHLQLGGLALVRDGQSGNLRFEATGQVTGGDGTSVLLPLAKLGIGEMIPLPASFQTAFPQHPDEEAGGFGVWLEMPPEEMITPANAAWFLSFGKAGVRLYGMQPLADDALTFGPGMTLDGDPMLRISLDTTQGIAASFELSGRLALHGPIGPLSGFGGIVTTFRLTWASRGSGTLGDLLADPSVVLDNAFQGRLQIDSVSSAMNIGPVSLGAADFQLELEVESPENSRSCQVKSFELHLESAQPVSAGGFGMSGLRLNASYDSGELKADGSAFAQLPAVWSSQVYGSQGSSFLSAFKLYCREPEGTVSIHLDVPEMTIEPGINLLEISNARLHVSLFYDGANWSVTGRAGAVQSWGRLAERLERLGIARLPRDARLPDVYGEFRLKASAAGTAVSVHFAMIRPGSADPADMYRGPLGTLPLLVEDVRFAFDYDGVQRTWELSGDATVSAAGWLSRALPFHGLRFSFLLEDSEDSVPDLTLLAEGGFPAVTMPGLGGPAIAMDRLYMRLGSGFLVKGDIELTGRPPLAQQLGADSFWNPLLDTLDQLLPDRATLTLNLPREGDPEMTIVMMPDDPPSFQLLRKLSPLVSRTGGGGGGGGNSSGLQPLQGVGDTDELFVVTPSQLRLTAVLSDSLDISLSISALCSVYGETFDLMMAVRMSGGQPEFVMLAGADDPVRLTVPTPDPRMFAGSIDDHKIQEIAAKYGLDAQSEASLMQLKNQLNGWMDELSVKSSFVFEIHDFGLRIAADGNPTVSGSVRIVQMPGFVSRVLPPGGLDLSLGTTLDAIYISMELPETADPVLRVPIHQHGEVRLYLYQLKLGYVWASDAVAFRLDADVQSDRGFNPASGTGIYVPPVIKADLELGATVTTPPVPIPEGALSFEPLPSAPKTAADDLGLQLVIGTPQQRFMTLFVRELQASPTYFLLSPGAKFDGGLILGGPKPQLYADYDAFLNVPAWPKDRFYARFTVRNGMILLIPAMLGAMMNPLAFIPPFISAMPPYWLVPPGTMYDLYADEVGVSLYLPGLVSFDMRFRKPFPHFTLMTLIEFAALASTGFSRPIEEGSELHKLFFVSLQLKLELLAAGSTLDPIDFEIDVNLAEILNGAMQLLKITKDAIRSGADALQELRRRPELLVRMIPAEHRRFELTLGKLEIAGFKLSGSLYLLTPEELERELVLFFENRRARPRGIAALTSVPAPPPRPGINLPPGWTAADLKAWTQVYIANPLDVSPAGSEPYVQYITQLSDKVLEKTAETHLKPIEYLKQRRLEKHRELVDKLWESIAETKPEDKEARFKLFSEYGFADMASTTEQLLQKLMSQSSGEWLPPGKLPDDAVKWYKEELLQLLEKTPDFTITALSGPEPKKTAETIIAKAVSVGSYASPASLRSALKLATYDEFVKLLYTMLPEEKAKQVAAKMKKPYVELSETVRAGKIDTETKARQAASRLQSQLATAITETEPVIRDALITLEAIGLTPEQVSEYIQLQLQSTWEGKPDPVQKQHYTTVYPGTQVAGWIQKVPFQLQEIVSSEPMVEKVTGYEIRLRPDAAAAITDASAASFNVAAPSAAPVFKVAFQAAQYQLMVRQNDGTWKGTVLPPALVNTVSGPLNKSETLQRMFTVVPKRERRPPTQAELDAVAVQYDTASNLYLTSILARPEYEIKPSGGIHGPLYLADFMKSAGTEPPYIVPSGPALLAGVKLNLWGSELQLCGIILVSDASAATAPASPAYNIFLHGHKSLTLTFGGIKLRMEGQFTLVTGTLWEGLNVSDALDAAALSNNTLAFSGFIEIADQQDVKLRGEAQGHIRMNGGQPSAQLKLKAWAKGSVDLSLLDQKLARLTYELNPLELDVTISGMQLDIRTAATFMAGLQFATFATKTIELIPSYTICVSISIGILEFEECVTTPAVRIEVPDLSTITWGSPIQAAVSIQFHLGSGGLEINMDLQAFAGQLAGLLPSLQVKLPNLL